MKIYTDLKNIDAEFWPTMVYHEKRESLKQKLVKSSFQNFITNGNFFEFTNQVESADFALLPLNWECVTKNQLTRVVDDFIDRVNNFNLKTIVFFWSDSDEPIPIENAIVFRTSLNKSVQSIKEFAMPCWGEDLIMTYTSGELNHRNKKTRPTVGFRGQSEPISLSIKEAVKKRVNKLSSLAKMPMPFREHWCSGHQMRTRAIKNIQKNRNIETDFQITNAFGGQQGLSKSENTTLFVENIFNTDYNLCVRGAGNYSYRLYEVLSAGRIPVIINTDLVLPYDFILNWKGYAVWVEEDELDIIDEKILKFHENLNDQDFVELQYEIRKLWDDWISPYGFFKNLHTHF